MDAVTVIAGSKTGQNAENGVGIIDITGPRFVILYYEN